MSFHSNGSHFLQMKHLGSFVASLCHALSPQLTNTPLWALPGEHEVIVVYLYSQLTACACTAHVTTEHYRIFCPCHQPWSRWLWRVSLSLTETARPWLRYEVSLKLSSDSLISGATVTDITSAWCHLLPGPLPAFEHALKAGNRSWMLKSR